MNRRGFLTAIGAGTAGAGAIVGTGGFTRVKSQRRVKIDVGEKDEEEGPSISGIAFCQANGGLFPNDVTIEEVIRDEDGDPIRIVWSSEKEIDTIVVWGGGDMYYRDPADGDIIRDGEPTEFTPQSPCPDNECGLKFDDFEEPIEPVEHQDECEPEP